jgi:ATP-dependent RNA helicase RhlE
VRQEKQKVYLPPINKANHLSMSFRSLGLSKAIQKALDAQKYSKPYPIQEKAIPAVLARKDVLGIAKTGSGKTASYVLPILHNLPGGVVEKNRHITVLVIVPTRELAIQVNEVFEQFIPVIPERLKSMAVHGGISINPQMIKMQGVNILVATPGRLLELAEAKAMHLSSVKTLVLDEADKMLNLGFKEEMDQIFKLLPTKRQNLLFSATLNDDVAKINQILLNEPVVIKLAFQGDAEDNLDQIDQKAYFVSEEKKGPLLRYLIKTQGEKQILIFTASGRKADNVGHKLRKNGIHCEAIHGKKSQGTRNAALHDFKTGKLQILVATDLLSRGIDIEGLPCVINYELPRSPKDYVHRIGRTGRANATGEAFSLITPEDEHHFKIIQKKMGKWVDRIDAENLEIG